MQEITTKSSAETQIFARDFAKKLQPGTVLLLVGELGAGKTTFVQGLAEGLGIREIPNSPSFIVVNEHRGDKLLVHADLYRLENIDEIADLGLEEYFNSPAITVIEWGEKLGELVPKEYIKVEFEVLGREERKIKLSYNL